MCMNDEVPNTGDQHPVQGVVCMHYCLLLDISTAPGRYVFVNLNSTTYSPETSLAERDREDMQIPPRLFASLPPCGAILRPGIRGKGEGVGDLITACSLFLCRSCFKEREAWLWCQRPKFKKKGLEIEKKGSTQKEQGPEALGFDPLRSASRPV